MAREKEPLEVELSRRGLFVGAGLGALALAGDTQSNGPESPVDKYDIVAAFGDSYTLGLGASCPENAYPRRLASDLNSIECQVLARSGCTPKELVQGIGGLPSQIDRIPSNANLLVGTIGGNATNLRNLGMACINAGCGHDTPTFEEASAIFRSNDYYDDLKRAYDMLLGKAPNADIMISGYPKLIVPYNIPTIFERLLRGSGVPELTALGKANDEGVADIVEMNNTAAQEIISRIGDRRLIYVEPPKRIDIISTRLLHKPDNFHLADSEYAGHPNDHGYEAMKDASFVALTALYNRNKRKTGLSLHGMGMGK